MTNALRPILGDLNRPIIQIYRGILDANCKDQAPQGISEITDRIIALKIELDLQYPDQFPESLIFPLKSIAFIMHKLQYWYDRNELYNNPEAEVFMDGFKYNKLELLEQLEEIDREREVQGVIV